MTRKDKVAVSSSSTAATGGTSSSAVMDSSFMVGSFVKAANACDKYLSCSYVKKQLEDEWLQEEKMNQSASNRVWNRMDKGIEVELYRQFLFESSHSLEHSFDVAAEERSIRDGSLSPPMTPPRGSQHRATTVATSPTSSSQYYTHHHRPDDIALLR